MSTMSCELKPILVLGGTGKIGRRVVERLEAKGRPVRIGSRIVTPPFDSTWSGALEGVESVYISYYPDLAIPGAVDAVGALAREAVKSGASRLVLLSGRGEIEAERAEDVVRESGADLTILRATWFMQNFSEGFMLDDVLRGELRYPTGDVPTPFVNADDIADIAVASLTDDRHIGQLYELTGPRSLTFREAAAEIASGTGRQVRYVPVSLEEFAGDAASRGVPKEIVSLLTYLFSEVVQRNAETTDGVRRALGREPADFTEYVRQAAAAGAWSAQ